MKLTKKLQEESVRYLEDYLQKERTRPLPKEKVKAIKELIEKGKQENRNFAEKISGSLLYKLAVVELIRENEIEITEDRVNHQKILHIDFGVTFLKMAETIKKTEKTGNLDLLNKYLEGK